MQRQKIKSVDLAWFRMDRPENPMMITSLIEFEKPLDYGWVKEKIEATIALFPRFHQRLVQPGRLFQKPYWEDDSGFDITNHIERINFPTQADETDLLNFINRVLAVPLNPDKPLWRFYFFESYQGGCALVGRIHHVIADGISLMQVVQMSLDKKPNRKIELDPIHAKRIVRNKQRRLQEDVVWNQLKNILVNPSSWSRQIQYAFDMVYALLKLAFRPADPRTFLKGKPELEKHATWTQPLEMQEIRKLGKVFQCTVNDILMSIVAGALGRYMESRGVVTKNLTVRAFILVNLRPLELDEELGNNFGIVYMHLPVGIRDHLDRLGIMKNEMDEVKTSKEAQATHLILRIIGHLPYRLQNIATRFFDSKGSIVMTNVPGPKRPLFMADSPVSTIMAWVPQSGNIGLGFSVVSYNGKALIGISADKRMVPDLDFLLKLFYEEFAQFSDKALQSQQSGSDKK